MKKIKVNCFDYIAMGIFMIIPIALYFNTLFDGGVNVNFDGLFGYSVINYYNQEILSGELPLWNKYVECGVVMGSFHTIGLYPFAILFSFLPIKTFTFVFYFFHIILGSYFFYLYLKEINCDNYSAITVALIYEMSTHIGGYRKEHFTIIIGIIYLPVILYFVQKYINTEKLYWLILASIAMGFQFLGSHTQIVVYSDIAIFVYLVLNLIIAKRKLLKSIKHIFIWGATYIGTILGQLYLTGQAMFTISQTGGQTTSTTEYLRSWSIHYVKLFMMAFPKLFGEDTLMPYGNLFSSEMDIEIYLGFFVFLLICFGILKKNNYMIRTATIFMTIAFVYASLGHIPYLAEIIEKLPIINGFRVPSRSLFIFIFFAFVILAIVVNDSKDINHLKNMIAFLRKEALFWLVAISSLFFINIVLTTLNGSNNMGGFYQLKEIFYSAFRICLFIIVMSLLFNFIMKKHVPNMKVVHLIVCTLLICITIMETNQYATRSYRNLDGYLTRESSAIEKELASGNYKTIDAFSKVGIQADSFISYNNSVNNKIQCINAYVTYNNMNIYKLLTGNGDIKLNNTDMFYVFPNMEQILRSRNSALSILGVKYIIDSCDILSYNPSYYDDLNTGILIAQNTERTYELTSTCPIEEYISLHNNQLYKIEFDVQSESTPADIFYLDVYDANRIVKVPLTVTGETGHKALIYYLPDNFDASSTLIRMSTTDDKHYTINNLALSEIITTQAEKNKSYIPYYDDGRTKIYLNDNAKDILFATTKAVSIPEGENLYSHLNDYDLLNVSYITDYPYQYKVFGNTTDIKNVLFETNTICATVISDTGTFINFSQNHHFGWKAYVDGEKVPVYLVDEAIMGIEVPAGEHKIEFVFKLPILYVCLALSFLTVMSGFLFFGISIYHDSRKNKL